MPEEARIKSLPYQIILNYNKGNSNVFYLSPSSECDMLFDNDPNSFIEILQCPDQSDLRPSFVSFMRINSKTVIPSEEHPWFICTISGIWSGSILEKKIVGGLNYIFYGQNKLIVNSNSLLNNRIRELNQNGQIIKLCKLVDLLTEADRGFIDESIREFL